MKMEEIIKEVRKLYVIADLMTAHQEEEIAYIGVLISDITHPLLQKLQDSIPESILDQT